MLQRHARTYKSREFMIQCRETSQQDALMLTLDFVWCKARALKPNLSRSLIIIKNDLFGHFANYSRRGEAIFVSFEKNHKHFPLIFHPPSSSPKRNIFHGSTAAPTPTRLNTKIIVKDVSQ